MGASWLLPRRHGRFLGFSLVSTKEAWFFSTCNQRSLGIPRFNPEPSLILWSLWLIRHGSNGQFSEVSTLVQARFSEFPLRNGLNEIPKQFGDCRVSVSIRAVRCDLTFPIS